jgi:hypothetical protein
VVIFAPATNTAGRPYTTFNFVANDGQLDSSPATVTVNILLPLAPQFTGASRLGGGSFLLNFSGSSIASYRVWGSTNLSNWVLLGTAQNNSGGAFQFIDYFATNFPYRFYRAGAP